MKLMLDNEMFNRNYKSFKDVNDRNPYIICNDETLKMLPQVDTSDIKALYINNIDVCTSVFPSDCKQNETINKTAYIRWYGIKVFIDNDLVTGEVIFA